MLPLRMNTKKWARATARKGGKAKGQPRISQCGVRVTKRSQDASRQGAALNELIELARKLIILFLPLYRVFLCVYDYIGKRRKRKWKRKKIEIGKVSQPPPLLLLACQRINKRPAGPAHTFHPSLLSAGKRRGPFPFCIHESCQGCRLNSFIIPSPFSSVIFPVTQSRPGHTQQKRRALKIRVIYFWPIEFGSKAHRSLGRYRSVAGYLIIRPKKKLKIVINQPLGSLRQQKPLEKIPKKEKKEEDVQGDKIEEYKDMGI